MDTRIVTYLRKCGQMEARNLNDEIGLPAECDYLPNEYLEDLLRYDHVRVLGRDGDVIHLSNGTCVQLEERVELVDLHKLDRETHALLSRLGD